MSARANRWIAWAHRTPGLCAERRHLGGCPPRPPRPLPHGASERRRRTRGVALLSLEEKIDTSSAAGELVFHVFGAIAHFERRLIAERTKDGIAAARARGKRPGRQPIDTDKVQAALKLVQAGLSPTKAASQLGLGRSTVYREVAAAGLSRRA